MPRNTASKAFNNGQLAGLQDRAAGLNPYEIGTADYADWERGRLLAAGAKLERTVEAARRVA